MTEESNFAEIPTRPWFLLILHADAKGNKKNFLAECFQLIIFPGVLNDQNLNCSELF